MHFRSFHGYGNTSFRTITFDAAFSRELGPDMILPKRGSLLAVQIVKKYDPGSE